MAELYWVSYSSNFSETKHTTLSQILLYFVFVSFLVHIHDYSFMVSEVATSQTVFFSFLEILSAT